MKKYSVFFTAIVLFAVLFYSCSSHSNSNERAVQEVALDASATADMTQAATDSFAQLLTSSVSKINDDSTKKFIRTANVDFHTKDVVKTTYGIETLAMQNGGYVENSDINNRIANEKIVQISKDSAYKITRQILTAEMTVRVPAKLLDSTLQQISTYVEQLNSRDLKAENVTLKYLSEDIQQRRAQQSERKFDSLQARKSGDVGDFTAAENARYKRQLDADAARLALMEIEDKINFSTIELSILENEKTIKTIVPYNKDIREYKPGFGFRVAKAMQTGWNIFLELLLIFIGAWWLWLLLILLFVIIRSVRKNNRMKKQ